MFNNVYDISFSSNAGFEIIEVSTGGYLVAGTYSDTTSGFWIIRLDNLGDTTWTKQYSLSVGGDQAYDVIELLDGGFVLCGRWTDTVTVSACAFLMKINSIGDSLWLKKYSTANHDYANSVALNIDGGFLVAGEIFNANPPGYNDAWVFKTDSLGNIIWQKTYDIYGLGDVFNKVLITPDSGIVCAGATQPNAVNGKEYVVKLNQQGDTVWTKEFGGIECGGTFNLNLTSDNGFIGCGAICINGEQRASVYRLDSLGNQIWYKSYARGDRNYSFSAIHEMPNGNFMAAGVDIDVAQPILTGEPRVRLFELNALGDSIWSKQYTHYGAGSEDYLFDMKLTSDGGYIMCGYIINGSLPQKNDVLVIKIDSNGCAISNCTVGINENTIPENEIIVYPNPSSGIFTIEIENLENAVVEIYNISGQLVKHQMLKNNYEIIDINQQPNGLYLVKISSNKQVITKRIVKY